MQLARVLGSVVARVRGPMTGGIPTFVRCPPSNDGGPAFLGNACGPFDVYATGKPLGLNVVPSLPLARHDARRRDVTLRYHGQHLVAGDDAEFLREPAPEKHAPPPRLELVEPAPVQVTLERRHSPLGFRLHRSQVDGG